MRRGEAGGLGLPLIRPWYATNLKITISQRSLRNLGLLPFLFEFYNFSFLIDIIDNWSQGSHQYVPQNSHQWQCSILVKCLRLYHETSIRHCHWWEFWSCDTFRVKIPRFSYKFDTAFYQFLETGTSDRTLMGLYQLLKCLGFSLHPFHFSLTVPLSRLFSFEHWKTQNFADFFVCIDFQEISNLFFLQEVKIVSLHAIFLIS